VKAASPAQSEEVVVVAVGGVAVKEMNGKAVAGDRIVR